MKIPTEHQYLFPDKKVNLTYWKGKGILILSSSEKEEMLKSFKTILTEENNGIYRFLKACMEEVELIDGEFELPESMMRYVESEALIVSAFATKDTVMVNLGKFN